jgi:transcriptional regulator with XRE-family HTH domain
MTQGELAQRIGLASHSHIAKIEADQDPVSLNLVIRIAQLLDVSTDYLLRDTIPLDAPTQPTISVERDSRVAAGFGTRLKALRLQRQLSQGALARQLGLSSRAYIGGLESDRGKLPSLELVVRMADLFGVSTDDLLRGVMSSSANSTEPGDESV